MSTDQTAPRKSGCFLSNGKRTVELEIGWYKEWLFENVYGWHFIGPVQEWPMGGPYVNLVVLNYHPSLQERTEIHERFKDALAPDGTRGLESPL